MDKYYWWLKRQADRTGLVQCCIDIFKAKRYLEIGLGVKGNCFPSIMCDEKVGVEINPKLTNAQLISKSDNIFYMSSDVFFNQYSKIMRPFDCIFIDGDHSYEQTKKDIEASLHMLTPNSVMIAHDATPNLEKDSGCNGVWRALLELKTRPDVEFAVGDFRESCVTYVSANCAVILKSPNTDLMSYEELPKTYKEFKKLQSQLFRFKTREELIKWILKTGGIKVKNKQIEVD